MDVACVSAKYSLFIFNTSIRMFVPSRKKRINIVGENNNPQSLASFLVLGQQAKTILSLKSNK